MSGFVSKPSEDLQERVEKTAISTGATLTVDIRRLKIRRDIQLRPGISLALKKITAKVAALAQRRGQPRSKSCATCMVGEGPFTECIVLSGQLTNKCANCYYSRSCCEFAKGKFRKIRAMNAASCALRASTIFTTIQFTFQASIPRHVRQ